MLFTDALLFKLWYEITSNHQREINITQELGSG